MTDKVLSRNRHFNRYRELTRYLGHYRDSTQNIITNILLEIKTYEGRLATSLTGHGTFQCPSGRLPADKAGNPPKQNIAIFQTVLVRNPRVHSFTG
jgi:hypothetical protein